MEIINKPEIQRVHGGIINKSIKNPLNQTNGHVPSIIFVIRTKGY